jgi:hypothetical protein
MLRKAWRAIILIEGDTMTENKWIKLSEQKPSTDENGYSGYMWIWSDGYYRAEIADYVNFPDGYTGFYYEDGGAIKGVTHWQKIDRPEPPEVEE